jgi:hypothetical protein
MEDKAYRNAMKRRQELQAELREIDHFLDLWKRYAGTEPEQFPLADTFGGVAPAPAQRSEQRTQLSREELAPLIRAVLIEHGRPMRRGQLVTALIDRGIHIGGIDPNKNLGTIMWRLRDRFTNLEGYGYWPNDVSCESAGYLVEEIVE